ncbi:outer membrane efflux protein [Flexistipes sinusarabici DSM 4947]|uniref:Outer membrane efflux protein n=1 Tax=Flexistipes sinusarabici (strain ATCC 49648 / DSM 4947 / MAS 10) TaxID=717231 RepID=F8E9W4_FLESM|nr:TolC family protein [Flexistipes sinusarabici]AEI15375.1 outer membrane efflux protein [Flexistipes sinusarabici DSM 4947]
MKKLFVLIMLLAAVNTFALSLDKLKEKAIENRPVLQKYRLDTGISEENVRYQKGEFMPSADLGYQYNQLDEDAMFENSENSNLYISLSYNLFDGFRDKYNLKSAKEMKKVSLFELQSKQQDIKLDVAAAYLNVYRNQRYLEVRQNAFKLYKEKYEDAKLKYDVGVMKWSEVLKIKVEMDNAKQELLKAQAELDKSLNTLSRKVNAEIKIEDINFQLLETIPEFHKYDFYKGKMYAVRSELKALETVVQARQYSVGASKSSLYPKVDLSMRYSNSADSVNPYGDNEEDELRGQVNVSFNIFNGFQKYANINKAKLEMRKSKMDVMELKLDLKNQLQNVFEDKTVALKNLEVARTSLKEAEENLRVTEASFNEGIATSTDILDAIYYLSRAKYNVINARTQVFLNYFKLQRVIENL